MWVILAFQGGKSLACQMLGSRNWDKINTVLGQHFQINSPTWEKKLIICRVLQQSYGDSDDNRQSQTACLFMMFCIGTNIFQTVV